VQVGREEFFNSLPKLIWHEDEPLVWPSSVSLYFVAQLARQHVTVVLTGEGSDETLAGYQRYAYTLWNARLDGIYRALVPAGLRRPLRNLIPSLPCDAGLKRRLQHLFFARDGESWASLYFDNFYSAFSATDQMALLAEELRESATTAYNTPLAIWQDTSGDLLWRLLYTDLKTYLVELLMKQDQMSMAASVESRVPFLDHELVEFAATIPQAYSTKGFSGKCILKAAVRGLLPESILHRRKMGFPTPWSQWLAGPDFDHVQVLLTAPRTLQRGFFNPEAVRRLFLQHRAGQCDHADRIWRLLNFEMWQRVFIDRDPAVLEPKLGAAGLAGELSSAPYVPVG
jgi:asparagine synthase (glutamine-hydrolysing)